MATPSIDGRLPCIRTRTLHIDHTHPSLRTRTLPRNEMGVAVFWGRDGPGDAELMAEARARRLLIVLAGDSGWRAVELRRLGRQPCVAIGSRNQWLRFALMATPLMVVIGIAFLRPDYATPADPDEV
jgi:hypothetical protein